MGTDCFRILILCAGGYLIIYSVYMMTVFNNPSHFSSPSPCLAWEAPRSGLGSATWRIVSTEEQLVRITERLDRIIEKIEKE